jgi:hypothetical protein
MQFYPPDTDTTLKAACTAIVADAGADAWGALSAFLKSYSVTAGAGCYNLSSQLPSGRGATISSGDWSGVGTAQDGSSWDFETCTFLIEQIGTNNITDMFIPREWTMEWLTAHCMARFGVTPQPRTLADLWGFDEDRLPSLTSRIVFTNGLNDGWSAGGILGNLSDSILAFNIPDGAHHSDLSHLWPSRADTPDVTMTRELVAQTLEKWLAAL